MNENGLGGKTRRSLTKLWQQLTGSYSMQYDYIIKVVTVNILLIPYHAHVWRLLRKLSIHDEVDAVRLEVVLQMRNVLGVLVTIQGETGHA